MTDDRGPVRRIAWRDICPWLIIFRCFHLSISLPVLFLATLGTLLTPAGWMIGETLFEEKSSDVGMLATLSDLSDQDGWIGLGEPGDSVLTRAGHVLSANVTGVYRQFLDPFAHLVANRYHLSVTETAYHLWGGIWNILVWAFVGGAITRIAAVHLGREERIGLGEALKHTGRHYLWYVLAPLFPMLGIAVVCVLLAFLGALMRLDIGVLIAGLVWLLALIGGLTIAAVMLGLALGWPLMWPSISSDEGTDAFDAFSRTFSYCFQRPIHYLFFVIVIVAFGALCWVLVSVFSTCVIEATSWGISWGAPAERMSEIQALPHSNVVLFAGAFLIRLCTILVHTVAIAFNHSFFWCTATAVYLLLRREVDDADFDEVFMEEEENRYSLPTLVTQGTEARPENTL